MYESLAASVFETTHCHWSSVTQSDNCALLITRVKSALRWLSGCVHVCVCVCVCLCVCVCEDVQMWVIIVIWADCRSHALLLSLHTHYICGHTTLLQCLITETTARDFNVTSATAAPRTYVCLSVFVIMHHFERVQPHWWLRACRQRSGSWLGTHMMRD